MKVNVRDRESGRLVTLDTAELTNMLSAWVKMLDDKASSGKPESLTVEAMKNLADNFDVIRQVIEGR